MSGLTPSSHFINSVPIACSRCRFGLACSGSQAKIYVEKNPDLAIADWAFTYSSVGNIALCMKGETELVAEINKAIAEVNEQGLYQQWMADATELAKSLGIEVDE